MGDALALVFAALLIGPVPVADDAPSPGAEATVNASVAEVNVTTNGTTGNASLQVGETDDADRSGSNASEGSVSVGADVDEGERSVAASTGPVSIRVEVGEGQIVDVTYTPPDTDDPVTPVEPLEPASQESPGDDEAEATASGQAAPAEDDGDDSTSTVAWTVAPVAGVAAAAAGASAASSSSWAWLRRLLGSAPLLPLYSRISRDDALDHDTREAMYEILKNDPGLALGEICDRLDLARSTARHHVRKLETVGMVDHTKVGRSRVHYPSGLEAAALKRHLLDNGTRRDVYETVEDDALTLTEIAERIGVNPGSVHFHIEKLVDCGLVEPLENGDKRYRAVQADDETPRFEPARA